VRRLLRVARLTLVDLALVGLAGWSMAAQLAYRVPSRYLTVLTAVVATAALGLLLALWLHAMVRGVEVRDRRLSPLALGHRLCAVVVLLSTFHGLFLVSNGTFDLGEATHHSTEIVRIGLDETALGLRLPVVWADVRSWRRPGELERMLLRPEERARLWGGQAVVVSVRSGFHGVPWIVRVEGDVEKQSREILAVAPEAARIRRDLADFYAGLGRFTEAALTTREYARRFPDDRRFPVRIARWLSARERLADVVIALEDVAPRREDPEVYVLLGHALTAQGRRAEGIALLERARGLQPRDWRPHYALGWAYAGGGDYARAVRMFQKAIELRPGLADAERELRRLRPLATRAAG
jgi:hypothetical protein